MNDAVVAESLLPLLAPELMRRGARLTGAVVDDTCPDPVSGARADLRRGLPAVYQEPSDGFALRFVTGVERMLDPLVAVIDCRASYVSTDLAPDGMIDEIAGWLGIDRLSVPSERLREVVAHAEELACSRGTRQGIALALTLCFPEVNWLPVAAFPEPEARVAGTEAPTLLVRCRDRLDPVTCRQVAGVVRGQCPLNLIAMLEHGGIVERLEVRP